MQGEQNIKNLISQCSSGSKFEITSTCTAFYIKLQRSSFMHSLMA